MYKSATAVLVLSLSLMACSTLPQPAVQGNSEVATNGTTTVPSSMGDFTPLPNGYKDPSGTGAVGRLLEPGEVERALNDPTYGPAIIITDKGVEKNSALIAQEAKKGDIVDSPPLNAQECYISCTISTQWAYGPAFAEKNKKFFSSVLNTKTFPVKSSMVISDTLTFSIEGGFEAAGIKAGISSGQTGYTQRNIEFDVPAGARVNIYTIQTGEGGYGTQYRYQNVFDSCSQAGPQCERNNFSAWSPQGLGWEIR